MRNGFLAPNTPFQRLIGAVDNPDNYLIHFMNNPKVQTEGGEEAGADNTIAKATGGAISTPGALDRYASTLPQEPTAEGEGQTPLSQKLEASRKQRMLQKQQNPAGLGRIVGRSGNNAFV